ncbi:hypothetical protein BAE44_0008834 [Dichanthelium oligosanthes]|uniref:Uncharacterized protein n=1 Tax=Dichanthelium oligosanthes TaxID=888268 RepID=A0A1E5VYE8_9POAL|nr:hypothetical protein BAE44_0008834 [Dichanthelium oligosanthes]
MGIEVPAYDRHGRRFDMRLKKTQANKGYRFFGYEWKRSLIDNELAEAMAAGKKTGRKLKAEVWAFRSMELLTESREEGDHHPDGALGVAILI